ncbi:MAG: 4-alpha-glucanotransferase [Halofilum sp. (in: g-proteobacteria)]|nr:4-alpha-glucanotransferase [Halofilum sp. (in: g-proteobacteria)]
MRLFGDLPLYCAHDSADAWARRGLFALDGRGRIAAEAGVPPDAFAESGQHWGQPLHDWARTRPTAGAGGSSACACCTRASTCCGWTTSAASPRPGRSRRGRRTRAAASGSPGRGGRRSTPSPTRWARGRWWPRTCGTITADVEVLRDALGLPGMRVLQLAFDGGADNPHLPANHPEWAVAYTGTHDNDTTLGWWRGLDAETRAAACAALATDGATRPGPAIDAVLGSRARLAVLPLQDLLALGSEARMNVPGQRDGNWGWRAPAGVLDERAARAWRTRLATAGRTPPPSG